MAVAARVAISQALVGPAVGTGLQRAPQSEHFHLQGRLGPGVAAARWACSTQSPFLHARPLPLGSASKMAGAPEGRSSTPRAALAESPPAVAAKDVAHQLPAASSTPLDLDVDTLQMALHAARLSALAYKTPVEVEYLRLRANGKSREDALQKIDTQAGGKRPSKLSDAKLVAQLEEESLRNGYKEILAQFDEPSQYFDGKRSLFMKDTEAYVFFRRTPQGQRNVLYCVFRGTEEDEDKLDDLDLWQVQIAPEPPADPKRENPIEHIKDIRIHRGFRDQFVAVATSLTRNVEDAARSVGPGSASWDDIVNKRVGKEKAAGNVDGGFEVVVTGHSLGAALATIGSFMAALEHGPDLRVHYFGFGSPRVGNAAFAQAYKAVNPRHAVHFANSNDVVTGIPIPPHYVHIHGGYMLDQEKDSPVKGRLLEAETNPLSTKVQWFENAREFVDWYFGKQFTTRLTTGRWKITEPWSEHNMDIYITRVRALLEQAELAAKAGK